MTVYLFPLDPINGQLFPVNPAQGQNQYQWDSATNTWKLLGIATGVTPGVFGSADEIPSFQVNAAGNITHAVNVAPSLVKLNNALGYNEYIWPSSPGVEGQVLSTDSLGNLLWVDPVGPKPNNPNPIYVETWGSDGNTGANNLDPKATIEGALVVAQPGDEIRVGPGNYFIPNPLDMPEDVSIIGIDALRCVIHPQNDDELFWLRNGCLIQGFSFEGEVTLKGIAAFPPSGAGPITRSPLVQGCVNNIVGSIGLDVDGDRAGGLKSMVLDGCTQFNPNGIGVRVGNKGYSQIKNLSTICSDVSVIVENGSTASVLGSSTSFGNYGIISQGVSELEQTASLGSAEATSGVLYLNGLDPATRPYVGQVVYVGQLFYSVTSYNILDGGEGYTSVPDVTVQIGTGPNAIAAKALAVVENGSVVRLEPISSGQNYTGSDIVTVTFTGGGPTQPASAQAIKEPTYYTVVSASEPDGLGDCTVQLAEGLTYQPSSSSTVNFYRASSVTVNSHTMEYVGTGTNIATALPSAGGVPVPENEVVTLNGGRAGFTSLDHMGNFRVGQGFTINQANGQISGAAFTKSLLANIVPYILALS